MHGAILGELIGARHADLLREAERARRAASVRCGGAIPPSAWRRRLGVLVIRLGEAITGRPATTVTPTLTAAQLRCWELETIEGVRK